MYFLLFYEIVDWMNNFLTTLEAFERSHERVTKDHIEENIMR
jgi:hypothetical protein